jgi:secreted trypsin-like serine protease
MNKIFGLGLIVVSACSVDSDFGEAPGSDGTLDSSKQAITHGQPDGDAHPAVVLLTMWKDGVYQWRCSGTLLNPTTVLTAGHCTEEPGTIDHIRVFTESDVQNGSNDYPNAGPNAYESVALYTHPLYTSAAFYVHDAGVVKLAPPGVALAAGQYGSLPKASSLDGLAPKRTTTFTAVGYGLQKVNDGANVNPRQLSALKIRMNAEPHLLQINTGFTGPGSLMLSNNASSGGTCFGDSGGPNFVGSSLVVGGITSFGLNGSCGGTGGVFRADRQDVLDFVAAHLD